MEENKILARVRALLAKAESTEFVEEADSLNRKAAELIAQYGIDQALLADSSPGDAEVGDRIVVVPAPWAVDKAILLHNVAKPLRVKTVRRTKDRREGGYAVHLFGFEADLERVELLFTSLLVQVARGLVAAEVPWFEQPRTFRRSWLSGFTSAVRQRLDTAEARAQQEHAEKGGDGSKLALVLVTRKDQVDRRAAEAYPDAKAGRPRRLAGTGGDAGYRAGQRADLGGTRVRPGSPRRAVGS